MKSIEQLCMVVLGGLGNMWGSFVGATILTVVPEMLRSVADLRLLIYGAVLILMMRVRPQGILGESPANGGFKNNSYSQWIQTRLKRACESALEAIKLDWRRNCVVSPLDLNRHGRQPQLWRPGGLGRY